MTNIGIYSITCLLNNKMYIGYSTNFKRRESVHFRRLKKNKHKNDLLQNDYNLYGEEFFIFEVIEEYKAKFLTSMEHYWCNMLNTRDKRFGYNMKSTCPNKKTANPSTTKSGIYTITCLANNKTYVGKTKDIKGRWLPHICSLRKNKHWIHDLQEDFNSYGEINIIYELLIECNKEFLYSEEHYWCNLLRAHNPLYGYNRRPTNPYGKCKLSEIDRIKVGLVHKKPVVLLSIDGSFIGRYNSCRDLAKHLNIGVQQVYEGIGKKYKYYKKYIFILESEYDPLKDYLIDTTRKGKQVIMYDKNMKYINDFISISEAARYINTTPQKVWSTINKPNYTCYGYTFKLKE